MARITGLLGALALSVGLVDALNTLYLPVCQQIEAKLSPSANVIYPLQALSYADATRHWFLSSSESPSCVVEVATPRDVSEVLKIVGATRTPFAVQSGGHASNPGFSSTIGVHISLSKFDQVTLSADKKTVEVGFGLLWKDVYDVLVPLGLSVVGGRVIGPGVGGFTVGGGFSWKTNQYGLTVDTVVKYNVVLPNGTITSASDTQNQDLFFALKGGMNRFGIVTSAVLKTVPQTDVWGGLRIYPSTSVPALLTAIRQFNEQNTDPKAQIITTVDAAQLGTTAMTLFFYDGPSKPAIFDLFDGVIALSSSTGRSSFTDYLLKFPSYIVTNLRGRFASISTSAFTDGYLAAIKNQSDALGLLPKTLNSGTMLSWQIEPFTDYGTHATDSAYPHFDSPLPLNLYFAWASPYDDEYWVGAMKQALAQLKQVAIDEGIYRETYTSYPNYALGDSTAEEVYGANTARLRAIRDIIDPARVMDLAGGFAL